MIVSSPQIFHQFFDQYGEPLAGGKLYTYAAGTSVQKNTFKDALGLTLNTNPIILDDVGICQLFILADESDTADDDLKGGYRFILKDKNDVEIRTVDNITAVKGEKGTPGGPKGDKGDPGIQGVQGVQGSRGYTGQTGEVGPKGDNGSITIFWNKAGTDTWIVPEGVTSVEVEAIGAGGATYIQNGLPAKGTITSGTCGKYYSGKLTVSAGDTITVVVGEKGIASADQLAAQGKESSISSPLIPKITAAGGSSGVSNVVIDGQDYFMKMPPIFTDTLFNGTQVVLIPQPVFGESCKFGQGGNIYTGSANATGNGSSGGCSIPSVNSEGKLEVASFGDGADGYVSISYVITE